MFECLCCPCCLVLPSRVFQTIYIVADEKKTRDTKEKGRRKEVRKRRKRKHFQQKEKTIPLFEGEKRKKRFFCLKGNSEKTEIAQPEKKHRKCIDGNTRSVAHARQRPRPRLSPPPRLMAPALRKLSRGPAPPPLAGPSTPGRGPRGTQGGAEAYSLLPEYRCVG